MKTMCAGIATILLLFSSPISFAIQHDTAYLALQEKNKDTWAIEDKEIRNKLQALEKKFGKKPNIIYILADDIGWGELGSYMGGKLRGTPTPKLDKLADSGMKFLSHYSEPSCTPTRIALMTGRHPIRTGLNFVLWPGQKAGLSSEEVTIAEVLSQAGYHTAMWGKWHVGELPKHAPENQGFDYAYYSLYNGAAWGWPDMPAFYKQKSIVGNGLWYDYPGNEEYAKRYGIKIEGVFEGHKGKDRKQVGEINAHKMVEFEDESIKQINSFIKEKAKSDHPFFIYWATFANQVVSSPQKYRNKDGVDSRNNQAAQLAQHDANMYSIIDTLQDENIAENTLLIWVSDNGPMYAFWPTSGYSWLRGEKGDVYEGGVRTPGIAWWPGMIKAGQDPIDMIHVTDLFTTAASIAGATDKIPSDRITDGVDQSSLLFLGEGHSRRNYMFHYSGKLLGAARLGDLKMHIKHGEAAGGLPPMEVYNIMRDPRETHGSMYNYLWAVTPFQNLIKEHMRMIEKYPNRVLKN